MAELDSLFKYRQTMDELNRGCCRHLSTAIATVCLLFGLCGRCLSISPQTSGVIQAPDTFVRIHYEGGDATFSSSLTLSKHGSESQVQYTVENAIARIPRPDKIIAVISWDEIWARLDSLRFYELRGDGNDPGCQAKTVEAFDANVVSVEIRRGDYHRAFSYSFPLYAVCDGTRRMDIAMHFINHAFGNVMPFPK
jgi:hypothetical protein